MSQPEAPKIEFPCEYPIKIMGYSCEEFRDHVLTVMSIHAPGFDVQPVAPLAFSSAAVTSTTPERLGAEDDPSHPVVVVGGGKTGMDTVQRLAAVNPGRTIRLVNGRGTLRDGQTARLVTSGGSGVGDPATRDRALVRRDLAEGKISQTAARDVYALSES